MHKIFKVNVNTQYDFDISTEAVFNLDSYKISDSKLHILHNDTSYSAKIISKDFYNKTYKICIKNNTYKVIISNETDLLINSLGLTTPPIKQVNNIKAPMPGLIIAIYVRNGVEVKENDPLLVLEAMKMENIMTSPRQGVIKHISIQKGDAVEKNQILIAFED